MGKYANTSLLNYKSLPKDVIEPVFQRLRDPKDSVREQAIQVALQIIQEMPDNIDLKAVGELSLRMRDVKAHLSRLAMRGLASVFILLENLCTESEWTRQRQRKYGDIPSKIIRCYFQTNIELKFEVEQIFDTILLPVKETVEKRCQRLIRLINRFTASERKVFSKLLLDKSMFIKEFQSFIELK